MEHGSSEIVIYLALFGCAMGIPFGAGFCANKTSALAVKKKKGN